MKELCVLPDVLEKNIILVIVGEKSGRMFLRLNCYYSHPGNRFRRILYETGLTPRQLRPCEYKLLLKYGIRLTDLIKGDNRDYMVPNDAQQLYEKIIQYKPKIVAFNEKKQ